MKITYLDDFHFLNQSILSGNPSLVKVGVVGLADLISFKRLYPESNIIIYEPDDRNFIGSMSDPNAIAVVSKAYNKAVGRNGHITIHRYVNSVSNSSYPRHIHDPNCVLKDSIDVVSVSIKTVLSENNLEYLDVLVINCEGGELQILSDLEDKEIRDRIGQICVSFHDPRIYPTKDKNAIMQKIGNYYHIIKGNTTKYFPDYLMIRKV